MSVTNFIHIGRNKCASTTLQYFFLNNSEALAREGVDYFVWGPMTKAFPNSPGFEHHLQYGAHIKAHPNRSTLISSEDFLAFGRMFAAPQIESLGGAPRKIIAYIRDYPAWVRSAYTETVMTGRSSIDFDLYLRQSAIFISALGPLTAWGDLAGWDNMHVRSLDPSNLHSSDVLHDCAFALGIDEDVVRQHRPDPKHVSPHWICTEIIRYIRAAHSAADWRTFTHEVVYKLQPLIDRAIADAGAEHLKAHYLSLEQAQRLSEMYNSDVDALNARMNSNIPKAKPPLVERAFLPSFDHVPMAVIERLMDISDEEYQLENPPARHALRTAFRWVRNEQI
jgi:hypothetical protein